MDVLRAGHSCTKGRLSGDFNQALVNEARREFIGEGQLFFYFKKFNIYPNSKYMTSELQFVLPRPDNENLLTIYEEIHIYIRYNHSFFMRL